MKKINLTILISLIFVFSSYSSVNPRYKANLKISKFEFEHKKVTSGLKEDFAIKYFEESEISEFFTSEKYVFGASLLGRPVWRNGLITHVFELKLYYRKSFSDKWKLISEHEIKDNNISASQTNTFGTIDYSININTELLLEKYDVEEDSNYLPKFNLGIQKLRIDGNEVKLTAENFEELYKKSGSILVGQMNGYPVTIYYEIIKGTAESIKQFKYLIYYEYTDISTGEVKKEKMANSELVNIFSDGYKSLNISTNGIENLNISYKVQVQNLMN